MCACSGEGSRGGGVWPRLLRPDEPTRGLHARSSAPSSAHVRSRVAAVGRRGSAPLLGGGKEERLMMPDWMGFREWKWVDVWRKRLESNVSTFWFRGTIIPFSTGCGISCVFFSWWKLVVVRWRLSTRAFFDLFCRNENLYSISIARGISYGDARDCSIPNRQKQHFPIHVLSRAQQIELLILTDTAQAMCHRNCSLNWK